VARARPDPPAGHFLFRVSLQGRDATWRTYVAEGMRALLIAPARQSGRPEVLIRGEMRMARLSLAGFKDPVRRPRSIIWTSAVLLVVAAVVVVAFCATSTYWFCAELCHSAQDDAINTYDMGSHSMVNCLSCHEPVNADPVTFAYYKAKAGIIGAYQLYTKTNETPLNPESKLALNSKHMGSEQCTQCHSENRLITPSEGILIDHAVHGENEIHCTVCHNRVAHPERGYEMVNTNPRTGEISPKHADFMTMTACFRCHTLTNEVPEGGVKAPGKCSACHPANFNLKPANHNEKGFYPAGHAELAVAPLDHSTGRPVVGAAETEESTEAAEGEGEAAEDGEGGSEYTGSSSEEHIFEISPVEDIDYCSTCHIVDTFCMDCHGMEMPHPEEFKTKTHPELVKTKLEKCDLCHNVTKTNSLFCNNCHHGTKVGWTYDPKVPWQKQHAKTVVEKGVPGCLGECHDQKFCVDCHTKLQPLPTSHKAKNWLHDKLTVTQYGKAAAAPSAAHALSAQKSIDSCDVCHGPGGVGAKFCKGCHVLDMPHPEEFKTNHVSGAKTPKVCANCHKQKELCSDCHHAGAKNGVAWEKQHPVTVAASGANPCFEKCHEDKKFCVDCHTKLKALPTSHKAADWTRRKKLDTPAKHPVAYDAAKDSCDYCHGDGGIEAKFCQNCHKLPMPHPDKFADTHKADFEAKKYAKKVCENCHVQQFCDDCHHEGSVTGKAWRTYHPNIVKKDGAEPCFECHEPTFCSYCHVRLIH
jgi:hypothetical protein